MRRLHLAVFPILGAALLLGAAGVSPAITLASAGAGASAFVQQATGYGPANGFDGPSWSGNNYPGAGITAWSGASYLNSTGWGPWGCGYPSSGYGWYSSSGRSYPGSASGGSLYSPVGTSYGYGSGTRSPASLGPSPAYDTGGLYYARNNLGYYVLPRYGGAC